MRSPAPYSSIVSANCATAPFESQAYRASGLNLLVAAGSSCGTRSISKNTLDALRAEGQRIPKELACHLAPLGWEHVSLTGDYTGESSTS